MLVHFTWNRVFFGRFFVVFATFCMFDILQIDQSEKWLLFSDSGTGSGEARVDRR